MINADPGLRSSLIGLERQHRVAPLPVNAAQILQFCEAIADDNPIYRDAAQATRAGFPGQVAPPAMAHSWTMPPLRPDPSARPLLSQAREIFATHGFDAVIATNYTLEHERYLAVGEVVAETSWIESVSDLKETPVGAGYFLTSRHEFAAGGRKAASLAVRVLHFSRPNTPTAITERPRAAMSARTPEPPAGEVLPSLTIAITPTLIVAGAIGSGDFERVHHDVPLARAQGLDDIVMNILTTTGLVSRYVTDWAGPEAVLRSISLALKAPNYPGDHMIFEGRSVGNEVLVRGRNGLGEHVAATVTVARQVRQA